jgi:hypothetical protein
VQRGFFDAAKVNAQTALDRAADMERRATALHREADDLLRQARDTRAGALAYQEDVLLKIGAEHGTRIGADSEMEVLDGRMVFAWVEPGAQLAADVADDPA